jgi:hypothetical protein
MNKLVLECYDMLSGCEFDYAFCGGHAMDIHLGQTTRPHGDIDLSAWWEDRNKIISFMQSQDWIVYEAMGGGKIHLITNTDDQKLIKLNIFCVKGGCSFFHAELIENDVYQCEIDHAEQKNLDYIEFLFHKRDADNFMYSRKSEIRRELVKAILHKGDLSYFAPELVLLYKSTDLLREENRQDFEMMLSHLKDESKEWLQRALITVFPDGHEWIARLEKKDDIR